MRYPLGDMSFYWGVSSLDTYYKYIQGEGLRSEQIRIPYPLRKKPGSKHPDPRSLTCSITFKIQVQDPDPVQEISEPT